MRISTVVATLAACVLASAQTGQLGDAQVFSDNPAGVAYQAVFPSSDKNSVRGSVVASSVGNGQGVQFQIAISGLPTEGGPFPYHIHAAPVPADGNCTGTLAHLDPYIRGEDPPCNSAEPATCQVGDLAGKHGKINGTAISASYVDNYVALKPGVGDFFGNRSIVVHFANKTRITCANFT
ncbi:Cu,Zn superoxide dismutase-like protein, partial [Saccharata proteae CBS 121410]